jgi:uncharacterized protein YjdB
MKRTLLATVFVLAFSLSMAAQLPNYTAAQVATHNSQSDCWIILNNTEVYNVTAFLSLHPAGPSPILPYCGANATSAFNAVGHSSSAVTMEATYLVGNLVASAISVTISPTTASVAVGSTQQFTGTASGSTKGVTWTSTSVGKVDSTGLFTGVTAGTGTVTATSVEDPTKSATAQVTVTSSSGGGGGTGSVTVAVTPSNMTLSVGAKQQFTAKVTGSTSGVTWTSTGSVGTIDSNGLFTATKAGMGVVKATSVSDPTKSASANVTVSQSGASCSLSSNSTGFVINCIPASAIKPEHYTCSATSSGSSTVVQCTGYTRRSGGGGDD